MSLALVQGYSSEEEVQERFSDSESEKEEGEDDDEGDPVVLQEETMEGRYTLPSSTGSSILPSAAMVFSEVTGPPEFLRDAVGAAGAIQHRPHSRKFPYGSKGLPNSRAQKELPAGVVLEAKPQVSVSYDRVRTEQDNKKEPVNTGLLPPEDSAKLLGVCVQCSVPKTYSAAKEGLMCPVCKDRPSVYNDADSKKRGSRIKDKERSKRMKGQSSHATWKSETEMHLRQQFD